ncbi:hypothetical protein LCGC14_2407060, partial [marine sediment metagenome]
DAGASATSDEPLFHLRISLLGDFNEAFPFTERLLAHTTAVR